MGATFDIAQQIQCVIKTNFIDWQYLLLCIQAANAITIEFANGIEKERRSWEISRTLWRFEPTYITYVLN